MLGIYRHVFLKKNEERFQSLRMHVARRDKLVFSNLSTVKGSMKVTPSTGLKDLYRTCGADGTSCLPYIRIYGIAIVDIYLPACPASNKW